MANSKNISQSNKNLEIIRPATLCKLLDVHVSTLYRWLEDDDFPLKRVQLGPRAVGFKKTDVEAYINGELENEKVA